MRDFGVLGGAAINRLLDGREREIIEQVRLGYLSHDAGDSVNPASHFLRFPAKPDARIIALPAYLGGAAQVAGIKWIASFPGNVRQGIARASAVLVLNDYETGYPFALLESAAISAARTAASAALATTVLASRPPTSIGVLGGGVIARTICRYLYAAGTGATDVRCHDLDEPSARALATYLNERHEADAVTATAAQALDCDLVVLATTAPRPHIAADHTFRPGQLVLNVSLRDLAPQTLLRAGNVLDDVDHCLTSDTSPHLAERLSGDRDFVTGTLAQVMRGVRVPSPATATIFSPFGLGVLDLAVGHHLYGLAEAQGDVLTVPDFFGDVRRW